ncbi:MAG: MFS transporter [Candidatus Poriferisodalaceae bacterium]
MKKLVALSALVIATAVSQSFGRFTYSVLYIEIRDDFGLSNTVSGGIGSINLVGYLIGSLAVALTIGRLGLIKTVKCGVAGVVIGLILLSWAPNGLTAVLALFLTGFAAAGVWITTPALATNILGPDRRGLAIGWVTTGVGLGFFAACIFDAVITDWRAVYGLEAIIGIAAFGLLALTITSSPDAPISSGLSPNNLRQVPSWLSLCMIYGLFAIGVSLAMTFSAALLEEDAGFKERSASLMFALIGLGLALGGPTMGWLSDRIGRNSAQLVSFAFLTISCALIATGHPVAAPISTLLFGVAFTGVVVNVTAQVSGHLSAEAFGAAYAVLTIVFGAGLAIGPQLGGIIADSSGSFRPSLVLASCFAAAGLLLTFLDRKPKIKVA